MLFHRLAAAGITVLAPVTNIRSPRSICLFFRVTAGGARPVGFFRRWVVLLVWRAGGEIDQTQLVAIYRRSFR